MIRIFLILFLLYSPLANVFGQTIKLISATDKTPIANALVWSPSSMKSSSSDAKGFVDISQIDKTKPITISHLAFHSISISPHQLDSTSVILLKEKIIPYPEFVISANKWQQPTTNVSQQILTIDRTQITESNAITTPDLLKKSGQVFVQKSQLGGGSPMLRGFAANSVLLVIDGVRMNNAIYRSGNLQNSLNIDPNYLSSSEILFGSGSVIYGSDALGGVISFKTQEPDLKPRNDSSISLKANTLLRFGSAAKEQTIHLDLAANKSKIGYFGSITATTLGDLRAGSRRTKGYKGYFYRDHYSITSGSTDILKPNPSPNVQKHSRYNLLNTVQKVHIRTGKNSKLNYSLFYSTTSDIPRYDALTEPLRPNSDSLKNAEWFYGPQKWVMQTIAFQNTSANFLFDQLNATVSYQNYSESRHDRKWRSLNLRSRFEEVKVLNVNTTFERTLPKAKLYYGIDLSYDKVKSTAHAQNIITQEKQKASSRYPDGGSDYGSSAVYFNWTKEISRKWHTNIGGRLNHIELKALSKDSLAQALRQDELKNSNQAVSGSCGFSYIPKPNLKLSSNLSSGFRAPNVDDIGKVFDLGGVITVPNPNLKPEYTFTKELSIEHTTDYFIIKATVYHTLLRNAIISQPYQIDDKDSIEVDGDYYKIEAQSNVIKANIYGFSTSLQHAPIKNWINELSFTYTRGQTQTDKTPLRHIPPPFGMIGSTYKFKKLSIRFTMDFAFNKDAKNIPESELEAKAYQYTSDGIPGWVSVNSYLDYKILRWTTISLAVENIFDQHYRSYSSGISAPGINFSVTVRCSLN